MNSTEDNYVGNITLYERLRLVAKAVYGMTLMHSQYVQRWPIKHFLLCVHLNLYDKFYLGMTHTKNVGTPQKKMSSYEKNQYSIGTSFNKELSFWLSNFHLQLIKQKSVIFELNNDAYIKANTFYKI